MVAFTAWKNELIRESFLAGNLDLPELPEIDVHEMFNMIEVRPFPIRQCRVELVLGSVTLEVLCDHEVEGDGLRVNLDSIMVCAELCDAGGKSNETCDAGVQLVVRADISSCSVLCDPPASLAAPVVEPTQLTMNTNRGLARASVQILASRS